MKCNVFSFIKNQCQFCFIQYKMSNLRRSKHSKNDRYEISLYSDPQEFDTYQDHHNNQTNVKSIIVPKQTSNISDIAIQQSYLTNLQSEIEKLKNQIDAIQSKETQEIKRRMDRPQDKEMSQSRSYSIQSRKTNAGRIYKRGESVASRRRMPSLTKQPQSTYYKWQPQIDSSPAPYKQRKDLTGEVNSQRNPNRLGPHYRIKQKSVKQTLQHPSNELLPPSFTQKRDPLKKKFKTQKILSENDDSPLHRKERTQAHEASAKKATQIMEQPQELKEIFLMTQDMEIKSINDDFRQKMLKKLRIPEGFPLETPKINQSLDSYQKLAKKIYSLFGLNVQKFREKLIVRKFKNGVYYQMRPNKNILWYFNGSFYLGQWDTDLPSQAQKNGFGFQYVPGKYYYLGSFKDGNRNGNGVIKIINQTRNDENFVAYDGEWRNGKPHGYGKHIDQNGHKYMGDFEDGQKTGNAIILNSDGLYYEGEIKSGIKNGYGVQKFTNGDVYSGNYLDDKFHGKGTYQWSNGSIFQGQFKEGIREGKGVWKSFNGDKFEGDYSNDVKHGWGTFFWRNGQIYEGEFKDDIREGFGAYKHGNGKIGRYLWKDGKIQRRLDEEEEKQYRQSKASKDGPTAERQQQPPAVTQ